MGPLPNTPLSPSPLMIQHTATSFDVKTTVLLGEPTFVMGVIKGRLVMHSLGPLRDNGLFGQGGSLVVRRAVCCAFPLHRPSVMSPCIFTAAQLWALYWHKERAGFALVLPTNKRAL